MIEALPLFEAAIPASPPAPTGPVLTLLPSKKNREKQTVVSGKVLDALRAAQINAAGKMYTLDLPILEGAVYAAIKPVLQIAGFVWKKKAGTHVGDADAFQALQTIIETGGYDDTKRGLEFFATSAATACVMAELLERETWKENPRILEPSAGEGVLVDAVLERMPSAHVTAVELDARRAQVLRERYSANSRVTVLEGDILSLSGQTWDGLIANFPFNEAYEHLSHILPLLEGGAYVVGIAQLAGPRYRNIAELVNDQDAWTDETEPETFVDTKIRASLFGFRVGRTLIKQLRTTLAPHFSIREAQIRELTRISQKMHTLFCNHCNERVDDYDATVASLIAEAEKITKHELIKVDPAWDPRAGYGFRLILPSGQTNDFGQRGMMVPTALAEDAHVPPLSSPQPVSPSLSIAPRRRRKVA